jgi:hypothetical protein
MSDVMAVLLSTEAAKGGCGAVGGISYSGVSFQEHVIAKGVAAGAADSPVNESEMTNHIRAAAEGFTAYRAHRLPLAVVDDLHMPPQVCPSCKYRTA